jgi:16S rRNA (cytidine1402-2'-O)-methyltransferase
MKPGSLSIVATPIGHPQDITLRALDVLHSVDAVICEEARPGSTLLKRHNIQKPLILLNEHNENQVVPEIVQRIWKGEHLALISDCGTPIFADPGRSLLQALEESGIRVTPVPGPASLTAAISVCKGAPPGIGGLTACPPAGHPDGCTLPVKPVTNRCCFCLWSGTTGYAGL